MTTKSTEEKLSAIPDATGDGRKSGLEHTPPAVEEAESSRREWMTVLLGGLGASALIGCETPNGPVGDVQTVEQALTTTDGATLEDLRSITVKPSGNNLSRFARSHNSLADGGGGIFVWTVFPSNPPADDNYTIIDPGSSAVEANGRWVRLHTLATIATLRKIPAPTIPAPPNNAGRPSYEVLGYYAAGDGGGGTFQWNAELVAEDNRGTIISPFVPMSPLPGRWMRVFTGSLNVKWFGAKGNGTTPDHVAISDAISASLVGNPNVPETPPRQQCGGGGLTPGTAVWTQPEVFFPKGVYLLDNTTPGAVSQLTMPQSLCIKGEMSALYSTNACIPLIRAVGSIFHTMRAEGMVFIGGKNHIAIGADPGLSESTLYMRNVIFKNCGEHCIRIEGSGHGSTQIDVDQFISVQSPVYKGLVDSASFRNGFVTFDGSDVAGASEPAYCFNSSGKLILENIVGTPRGVNNTGAWIRLEGAQLVCRDSGFGGETTLPVAKVYPGPNGEKAKLLFDSCAFGANDTSLYWLSLFGKLPQELHVHHCDFLSVQGVYVDEAISDAQILAEPTDNRAISYEFTNVKGAEGAARFLRPFKLPVPGLQLINDRFVSFFRRAFDNVTHQAHAENLVPSGLFRCDQDNMGAGGDNSGMMAGPDDTSIGYPLRSFTTVSRGNHGFSVWLTSANPGVYTYSVFVKSSGVATVHLQYRGTVKRSVVIGNTATTGVNYDYQAAGWQRIHFTFFHDGVASSVGFQMVYLDPGSVVAAGCFCINRGFSPAEYKFPGNPVLYQTTPNMRSQYFTSVGSPFAFSPSAGVYKVADVFWATNPQPGGYLGWVCTAAGTVGGSPAPVFKGFGAIAT